MTEQEAIKDLKFIRDAYKNLSEEIKTKADLCRHYAEALEMAVEVLEKQIPKNPIKTNIYEGERAEILKKRGAINPEIFKCPVCKKIIDPGYSNNYCKKCGQRIDWEQ